MRTRDCSRLGLFESGRWEKSDELHLRECAVCGDAAKIAIAMREVVAAPIVERKLPDPALIWLKSQILERRIARERVERPANVANIIAYGVLAVCWAALFSWKWPQISIWLTDFDAGRLIALALTSTEGISIPTVTAVVVLVALTGGLAARTVLAEE